LLHGLDWSELGYTFVDGRLLTYITAGGALTQLNVPQQTQRTPAPET